jgi:hypothetical protein
MNPATLRFHFLAQMQSAGMSAFALLLGYEQTYL